MVARNGKSVMKLVRLPILTLMMLKREVLLWLESFNNLEDLYAGSGQALIFSNFFHTTPLNFETFKPP